MNNTVGKILLKRILPESLHHYLNSALDKKGITGLFTELAKKHPDKYNHVASEMARLGFDLATQEGSSLTLDDLKSPVDKNKVFKDIETEVSAVKKQGLSKEKEEAKLQEVYHHHISNMDKDILAEGTKNNKTLAKFIQAGSRGSIAQYRATVATPGLVLDANDKPFTEFTINRSFAEGLTLPQYLAASYSARNSEIAKKIGTATGGYFSKQVSRANMTIKCEEHDCNTERGILIPPTSKDYIGCFLAQPIKGYKRNNEITPEMLQDLESKKVNIFLVRNAMTCESSKHFHSGAVCQMCLGIRDNGLTPIGSYVGIVAASSIGEPLAQQALSSKHCLFEDTEVMMSDFSIKKIKDIIIGDFVLGADKDGNTFTTKVINVFNQGLQECNEYKFRIGCRQKLITITSTADHVCLANVKVRGQLDVVNNHKIQLRKIGEKRASWYLVKPTGYTETSGCFTDEPFALLLGLLMGDGCYTKSVGTAHLSCFDQSLIEETKEYLDSLDLHYNQKPSRSTYLSLADNLRKWTRDDLTGRFTSEGSRCSINKKLEEYELSYKYAHEKVITSKMFNWSKASLGLFLGGLFSADGSIYVSTKKGFKHVGIGISSTSKELIVAINKILTTRFGIHTEVYFGDKKGSPLGITYKGKNDYVSQHDSWKLTISDTYNIRKFLEQIKFVGIKAKKVRDYEQYLLPLREPFFTCKRKSVDSVGLKQCYDIEVDCPDNLFVLGNGAIVHNSIGITKKKTSSQGFNLINQLANIPKNFPDEAVISDKDGVITNIKPSDAGGNYIEIDGREHYVAPHFDIYVKKGDKVEKGDVLTEGIVNPATIVNYKGIGEGRRFYSDSLYNAVKSAGMGINKRNFDILAHNAVDHVKITSNEGLGDYLPDQIVSYNTLEKSYKPREDAKLVRLDQAKGKFLETPVLHYTIGSPVDSAMISILKDQGIDSINVHDKPPGFEPVMERLVDIPEFESDWMHQMYSTYLEKRLSNIVNTGINASSDLAGASPVPGLAYGKGFGTGNH